MDANPNATDAKPSCNSNFLEIFVKSIDFFSAMKYPEINMKIAFPTCPIGAITASKQSLFENHGWQNQSFPIFWIEFVSVNCPLMQWQ